MRIGHPMILLILLVPVFTGCAALGVERPGAKVVGMKVVDVKAEGFTMNFDVDLTNPNAFDLPMTAADYTLSLAGAKALSGSADLSGSVPANDSKRVMLPVNITFDELLKLKDPLAATKGNVPYKLGSTLKLRPGTAAFGDVEVPIEYEGTLPLRDMLRDPALLLKSPSAKKLAAEILGGLLGR